ncbi:MAG TPA: GrpB family protein [Candidatus Paceibacterota bacterium]|nr:GrpB family protein [Candidatus Paceibacterota bacterium]
MGSKKQQGLGLRRGTVKLLSYRASWRARFEREQRILKKSLGAKALDIQHVGSTSIPGLSAKPIIDIALGVKNLKVARALRHPLEKLGYAFRPNAGGPYRLFFAKGPEARRTVYLHVLRHRGSEWYKRINFRDYLRTHSATRNQYAALKKTLAKKFADERPKYTAQKAAFIQKALRRARPK